MRETEGRRGAEARGRGHGGTGGRGDGERDGDGDGDGDSKGETKAGRRRWRDGETEIMFIQQNRRLQKG